MAKYDHGGGCPCGLYKECDPECEHYKPKNKMTRSEAIDLAVRRSIFDGGNMRTVQLVPTLRRVDVFDAPDIFLPLIRTEFYKIMAGEK